MAKVQHNTKVDVEFKTNIELTETEVRALHAIFGYDIEIFLKVFYEKMGRAYAQPFEAGIRSLNETVRKETGPAIWRIDELRRTINEALKKK